MPLASLVTLTELKRYIAINDDNSSFDASLKQLARVATKSLETYCRVNFSRAEYTEYFNTRNSTQYAYDLTSDYTNLEGILEANQVQRFPLKGVPVDTEEDITVWYDTSRQFADSLAALAATEFYINAAGTSLYLLKGTANAARSLKVTYTGGYTTAVQAGETILTGAPENLKLACITQVIYLFNKMQEGNVGVRGSKKHSPEYIQNEQMLCPEAQALAIDFRRSLVGKR